MSVAMGGGQNYQLGIRNNIENFQLLISDMFQIQALELKESLRFKNPTVLVFWKIYE